MTSCLSPCSVQYGIVCCGRLCRVTQNINCERKPPAVPRRRSTVLLVLNSCIYEILQDLLHLKLFFIWNVHLIKLLRRTFANVLHKQQTVGLVTLVLQGSHTIIPFRFVCASLQRGSSINGVSSNAHSAWRSLGKPCLTVPAEIQHVRKRELVTRFDPLMPLMEDVGWEIIN